MTNYNRMYQLASNEARKAYDWTCPKTGKVRHYPGKEARRGILPFSESTLYTWIREGKFPQPLKVNGVSVWTDEMINDWLQQQEQSA